ncbi:uncharacterized protein [Nicotiana tomentosiformis]|uniref:uncharacterized protein n=1 Tax=Nicotiana tomentosiformis TaxID=4098 RepID=UPI00388C3F70
MAKTSKIVPQKETPSTSQPVTEDTVSHTVVEELVPEPPLKMFIPGGCPVNVDFKVEKPSFVQGLFKDVTPRLPSGGKNFPAESPVPRQGGEKKRKRAPSSSSSEKMKPRRRLMRKSKESVSARAPSLGSLYRLRDESEEEEEAFDLASVLHHETFLRYRDKLNQYEAEVRGLTEKRDTYKLLSEQREGEAKSLRTKLEVARKEHADLVEQLASTESQLRAAKDKAEVQAKKFEDLHSQLSAAVSNRENLAKELKMAKSVVVVVKDDVDEMVAQYKADAEATQVRMKDIIEYAKRQSQREALEEIHAQGFDLSAEIESAKGFEAKAKKLAYLEDGSEGSSESEGG